MSRITRFCCNSNASESIYDIPRKEFNRKVNRYDDRTEKATLGGDVGGENDDDAQQGGQSAQLQQQHRTHVGGKGWEEGLRSGAVRIGTEKDSSAPGADSLFGEIAAVEDQKFRANEDGEVFLKGKGYHEQNLQLVQIPDGSASSEPAKGKGESFEAIHRWLQVRRVAGKPRLKPQWFTIGVGGEKC